MIFPTYTSKHGFTVFGQRPMFEASDEDDLGRDIKAKLLEVFGHYPVLDISEKWEICSDEEAYMAETVVLRDYHALLDTEKLDQITYGLNYVDSLLEKIIRHRMEYPNGIVLNVSTSKKYCFSDTEDWWSAMQIAELPEGRERFTLMVELG